MNEDLKNKLAIVTGGNSGLGLETALQLNQRGCTVVICSRSLIKGNEAKQYILQETHQPDATILVVQLDLADLDNVDTFPIRLETALNVKPPIDMLILNAGVLAIPRRELTTQGHEMQMGVNVLGHFKLIQVLFQQCKAAAQCRIVFLSSLGHQLVHKIQFDDFDRTKSYSGLYVYCETKLGDLLLMYKLNELFLANHCEHMMVVAAHPGWSNNQFAGAFARCMANSAKQGAMPTVLAATDPMAKRNGLAGPNGLLEVWGSQPKWNCNMNKVVMDTKLQTDLWNKCQELTGEFKF
jgi:NAD(P)-dependent dehydrogenase (short-subunit alcohol dehydrogenase family)